MISVIQRSRLWAWAGWLVAGLMLFGFLSLLVLSSASFNAPAMMALPTASPAAGFAPPVEESGGRGGDFFDSSSAAQPTAESQNGNAAQERLIIRNGSIALEVEDTRAAQAAVEGMVADMAGEGAFVVSSNEFGGQGERLPAISMAIRIPAARFDETMDRLASMAIEVINRNESGQDVTEEFVDLQARLETLEAARRRLLGLMEDAATTEELLMAEQQLTQREAELESIKGRMQYLEQSARLSNITIELQPSILNQPVESGWRPAETVRRSLERQLDRLQGFADSAISFVIVDLPWWIVFGLVVFAVVRGALWWRRRQSKQKPPAEPAAGPGG